MVDIVPWDNMAKVFFSKLSQNLGRPTVDLRIVLGALMISHVENLSDERTIEFIQENIYAQYFVGLSSFQADAVFTPSLFVEIRKRLGTQGSAHLNELLITEAAKLKMIKHRRSVDDGYDKAKPIEGVNAVENDSASLPVQVTDNEDVESVSAGVGESKTQADTPNPGERNRGQMVIDATVAPVQMAYPTDTNLLADCRRHSEQLLDLIYEAHKANWKTKPRTYRREAQKKSTNFSKKRSKGKKDIRKAVKNELGYLKRNFGHLNKMLDLLEVKQQTCPWSYAQRRQFWIMQEIYRQQKEMYSDKRRFIKDRIVSTYMPFIRPIKRGKGGAKNTEFGPKINATTTEGFTWSHRMDFNAFNEALDLPAQVEEYKRQFGYYPSVVLADKIYWTNANRKWLKERSIKMNATPKGRKPATSKYTKEKIRKRNNQRNTIEGKFGEGKNRYGMDNLRNRLPETIGVAVNLIFLAMNLAKSVREVNSASFCLFLALRGRLRPQYFAYLSAYRVIRPIEDLRGGDRGPIGLA